MIDWVHQEEGYCEGHFKSTFFRDDEKKDIFTVMSSNPDSNEYAEKCVEAFNNLTDEGIELSSLDNPLDILNHCWFTTLYMCNN